MNDETQDNDAMMRFVAELRKVQDNPRSLVVITSTFLELLTNTVVKHHFRNSSKILQDTRTFSYYVLITMLNEKQLIDNSVYQLLNKFRKTRNRASHQAAFVIDASELQYFNDQFRHMPIVDFGNTCTNIAFTFWNLYSELFMEELVE